LPQYLDGVGLTVDYEVETALYNAFCFKIDSILL
jgi:hypothetical protein